MKKVKKEKVAKPQMRSIIKAQVRDDGIWVNGHRVGKLTGFNHRDLEDMREDMNVTFVKEGGKIRYDLKKVLVYYKTVKEFKTA